MNQPTQTIFERVLLRPVEPDVTGAALLTWHADQGDWLVQVYVNGRLYDVTHRANQWQMWLHLDRRRMAIVELLAVDPTDRWRDCSDHLSAGQPRWTTQASLAITRDETLSIDARVAVTVDGQPHTTEPLWGVDDNRGGFGGLFGIGEFGRDAATGPGHGLGEFGVGPFNSDATAWRWQTGSLPAGEHVIACVVHDRHGRAIAELAEPVHVVIDAAPALPRDVTIDADFNLTWTP